MRAKSLRTCSKGHKYYKSSDCTTCPVCENAKRPAQGFLSQLSAPARRALENKGIFSLKILSAYSQEEIMQLHGLGPSSVTKLKNALKEAGLTFKK